MSASRILLSTSVITLASAYWYVRYLHQSFRSRVSHRRMTGAERLAAVENGELETLPNDLLENPRNFRIIHDRDEMALPNADVFKSNKAEELFTKLTRKNMTAFSNLPQSYILSMLAKTPEQRDSFQRSHLQSIDYREGDLFCGFYRVIKRSPFKVEIDLELSPNAGPMAGRLVVSLNRRGDEAFLRTETLQWIGVDEKATLPLERRLFRFMHEMASWWLLISDAEYMQSLAAV